MQCIHHPFELASVCKLDSSWIQRQAPRRDFVNDFFMRSRSISSTAQGALHVDVEDEFRGREKRSSAQAWTRLPQEEHEDAAILVHEPVGVLESFEGPLDDVVQYFRCPSLKSWRREYCAGLLAVHEPYGIGELTFSNAPTTSCFIA